MRVGRPAVALLLALLPLILYTPVRAADGVVVNEKQEPIAAQLEKATEHVENRSTSAANEHISKARVMLDTTDVGDGTEGEKEASEDEDDGDEGESTS